MGARSALHLNDLLWVAVSLPDPNPLKATNPTAHLPTSAPGVAPRARQLECVLCPTLFRWFADTIDAVRLMRELRAARCISGVQRTRHHYKTASYIETEKRHLCTTNLECNELNSTLLITPELSGRTTRCPTKPPIMPRHHQSQTKPRRAVHLNDLLCLPLLLNLCFDLDCTEPEKH